MEQQPHVDYMRLEKQHLHLSIAPLVVSIVAVIFALTVRLTIPAFLLSLGALIGSILNRNLALRRLNIPECTINRVTRYIALAALVISGLLFFMIFRMSLVM